MSKKFTLSGTEKSPGNWYYHLDTDVSGETSTINIESELRPSDFLKYTKLHQQIGIWLENTPPIRPVIDNRPSTHTPKLGPSVSKPTPTTKPVMVDRKNVTKSPQTTNNDDNRGIIESVNLILAKVNGDINIYPRTSWNPLGTTIASSVRCRKIQMVHMWLQFLARNSLEYITSPNEGRHAIRVKYGKRLNNHPTVRDHIARLSTIEDTQLVCVDLELFNRVVDQLVGTAEAELPNLYCSTKKMEGIPAAWLGLDAPPLETDWCGLCKAILAKFNPDNITSIFEEFLKDVILPGKISASSLVNNLIDGSDARGRFHPIITSKHNANQPMLYWYAFAKLHAVEIPLFENPHTSSVK